jgi:hypothetical protein
MEISTRSVRLTTPAPRWISPDPQFFTLPLAWAATGDHAEVVELLLERGADPNQRMGDDNTPMHTACFFGASKSAAVLMLEAGGDLSAPEPARRDTDRGDAARRRHCRLHQQSPGCRGELRTSRRAGRSAIAAMLDD